MGKIEAARKRWKGFLSKIEDRFGEIARGAEDGCLRMLDLANLDYLPMNNAWIGVSCQLRALIDKIEDTWGASVSDVFEEAYDDEDPDGDADVEFRSGEELTERLERDMARVEADLFEKAAIKLIEAAKAELAKDFACTQCQANLPLQENIFRSYFVACQYCGTVNTFEPGTKVRQVESVCADWIATADAFDEEMTMRQLMDDVHGAPAGMLQQLEEATKTYWTKLYGKRAELVPAFAASRGKDIAARMRALYVDLSGEDNWKPTDPAAQRFTEAEIVKHIMSVGKGFADAGGYPQDILKQFVAGNHDKVCEWLATVWEDRVEQEVLEAYEDDVMLFRQVMPAPSYVFFDGFLEQMGELYGELEG